MTTTPNSRVQQSVNKIIFLHIGKNAGTQITFLTEQLKTSGIHVEKIPHSAKLKAIREDVPYFFSVRDPITRFKSGFYSRKRKGQPRLYVEWSRYEAFAFQRFEHANDLAEALLRKDELGLDAVKAISSIRHTAMHQIDWFEGMLNLDLRPPVWIIRQENFEADFDELLRRLGLGLKVGDLELARDHVKAHRNDYSSTPELSALAKDNLRLWYARDFAFYDLCVDWMKRNSEAK